MHCSVSQPEVKVYKSDSRHPPPSFLAFSSGVIAGAVVAKDNRIVSSFLRVVTADKTGRKVTSCIRLFSLQWRRESR